MTQITWGAEGQRYFESGIDRGVLYPRVGSGVPWNGLTGISEAPNGGSPTAFYADGYKYLNLASAEEYEATLKAFSSPYEFDACDGTRGIHNGLFITQQPREQFGISYRTKIGNDTDGPDSGYKLHLVYNCLASPTARDNKSVSSSVEPIELSWSITTTPPDITGYRPSAHFVIDSRYTPAAILSQFEGMLYGTASTASFLPTVPQLMSVFDSSISIQLYTAGPANSFSFVSTPAVRSAVAPIPASGEEILWLDISAGYSKLTLVTGE